MDILSSLFNESRRSKRIGAFCVLILSVFSACSLFSDLPHLSTPSKNYPADIAIAAFGGPRTSHDLLNEEEFIVNSKFLCLITKSDTDSLTQSDNELFNQELDQALKTAKGQLVDNDDRKTLQSAADLFKSGQFFRDSRNAVDTATSFIPQLKKSIVSEDQIPRLVNCSITNPVKDILDDKTLSKNSLGCLYESPTGKELGKTAKILLENESVRLAIIVYAKANGIDLEDQHLILFRDTVLNQEDPDLTPLVQAGIEELEKKYGVENFDTQKEKMKRNQFDCIK